MRRCCLRGCCQPGVIVVLGVVLQILTPTRLDASPASGIQAQICSPRSGTPARGELAGGEEHLVAIELKAAQACLIVVEQQGVDLEVELRGPGGARLAVVDSPLDRHGPESLLITPEVSGSCCPASVASMSSS